SVSLSSPPLLFPAPSRTAYPGLTPAFINHFGDEPTYYTVTRTVINQTTSVAPPIQHHESDDLFFFLSIRRNLGKTQAKEKGRLEDVFQLLLINIISPGLARPVDGNKIPNKGRVGRAPDVETHRVHASASDLHRDTAVRVGGGVQQRLPVIVIVVILLTAPRNAVIFPADAIAVPHLISTIVHQLVQDREHLGSETMKATESPSAASGSDVVEDGDARSAKRAASRLDSSCASDRSCSPALAHHM
ncbi:hypothetical protein L249_6598, partial [Ophiocordyceps polyrhachis-furcata BCC 54312]